MDVSTEIYFTPENQRYLFIPTNTDSFVEMVLNDQMPADSHATFDYDEARATFATLKPANLLEVRSPLIAVFQGQYDGIPENLPLSEYVALANDTKNDADKLAFSFEITEAFRTKGSMNFIGDIEKLVIVMHRTATVPIDDYRPDISAKITGYNEVAESVNRTMGTAYVVDGKQIPNSIAAVVLNLTMQMPAETPFQQRWDALKTERDYVPPTDEELDAITDAKEHARARNERNRLTHDMETVKTIMSPDVIETQTAQQYNIRGLESNYLYRALSELKTRYGLTEQESGLLNGLYLLIGMYKDLVQMDNADKLPTKLIITPEDLRNAGISLHRL